MTRDQMVERIARASYDHGRVYGQPAWDELAEPYREHPRAVARAILADLAAAGLAVVPREPTEGILRAMEHHAADWDQEAAMRRAWPHLIAAAEGEG